MIKPEPVVTATMSHTTIIADVTFDVNAVMVICSFVGSFLAGVLFFTKLLDRKLADPVVLDSISSRIRPELIFSETGAILVDRGGGLFLADPKFTITADNPKAVSAPTKIVLHLNRHLKLPPILTPLNPDIVRVTAHRHTGNDFRFEFSYDTLTNDEVEIIRSYRLEFFS